MMRIRLFISSGLIFIALVAVSCMVVTIPLYLLSIPLTVSIEILRWGTSIAWVVHLLKKRYVRINPSF